MATKLAFFGATGGCVGFCLTAALKAGYICTAFARTPSKLEGSLLSRGVDETIMTSHLDIVSGDVRDIEAVKQVIAGADVIVSGVGAYPQFQLSVRKPLVLTDSTIYADASATILEACQSNYPQADGKKPILVVVSTAGVQEKGKPRALPLAYLPWYAWLLAVPLTDKISMEDNVLAHMRLPESQRGIGGYVIVKPSILTDGKDKSIEDVRAGTSDNPPVGYSIDREMVGLWMFHRLIDEQGARGAWKDTRVTITH
jgi:nucleoside-diphosphate-sugar epimerase